MNKTVLGTIVGTALLGLAKAKSGGNNEYRTRKIENIYNLSPQEKAQITKLLFIPTNPTHLPDDIFDGFTNLKMLSLKENNLSKLPESIGNLTNLEDLLLWGNQLTELPEWIGNLTNLKELYLSRNQLTELPKWIGNLTNLTNLKLEDNQLTELPEWVCNLTKLKYLTLNRNSWQKHIPKETIIKMIQNGVHKRVIEAIVKMNNSIPTKNKSNLRIR